VSCLYITVAAYTAIAVGTVTAMVAMAVLVGVTGLLITSRAVLGKLHLKSNMLTVTSY